MRLWRIQRALGRSIGFANTPGRLGLAIFIFVEEPLNKMSHLAFWGFALSSVHNMK